MTKARRVLPQVKPFWLLAWPVWALLLFTNLAIVRFLPGSYTRAAVAAPILMVPGSLTLGALFSQRDRPHGLVFAGYAALLSVVLSAFASLALYVIGVLITAASTFWCLLAVSAVLAIVAEARLLLERPGKGRRAIRRLEVRDSGQSDANADTEDADDAEGADTSAATRGPGFYSVIAAVAGASLLAGGLFVYDRLPHPTPVGYTWLAWAGPPVQGDIPIGSAGTKLSFQIVHHQPQTTTFQLSAAWLGASSLPLAKPLTFTVGPNQIFHGALFVPPLPNGCTYRIVVSLTAARQVDPLTQKTQTWSINADVRGKARSSKTCKG
jgi:hypothetical protein